MSRIYKSYPLDRPCGRCGEKDPSKFGFILGKYRKNVCRKCAYKYKEEHRKRNVKKYNAYQRDYYKRNRGKVLEMHKRWRYKITKEELEIHNNHNSICPICNEKKKLVIDHDHKTNKIRGIICVNCNIMLGHCKDNVKTLHNAIKYLIKGI